MESQHLWLDVPSELTTDRLHLRAPRPGGNGYMTEAVAGLERFS